MRQQRVAGIGLARTMDNLYSRYFEAVHASGQAAAINGAAPTLGTAHDVQCAGRRGVHALRTRGASNTYCVACAPRPWRLARPCAPFGTAIWTPPSCWGTEAMLTPGTLMAGMRCA
jgi:hypothetical protein